MNEYEPTWQEYLAQHDEERERLSRVIFSELQSTNLPADIKAHVCMSAAAAHLTDHQDGQVVLPLRRVFNALNHVLGDVLKSKLCAWLTDEAGNPTEIPKGLGS